MKRALILFLAGAVLGGGAVWLLKRSDAAEEKPAENQAGQNSFSHDPEGNVVISMTHELQARAGIATTHPTPAQWAPEVKAYGRVMDPGALAGLLTELAGAEANAFASSNELARLKILGSQDNISPRALQTAEAAAQRDQLAVQSARDRFALSSSQSLANRDDLPAFIQSLTTQEKALVRLDLAPGEVPDSLPAGARLATMSGDSMEAEFLGVAASVDPQSPGRGFIFLVPTRSHSLAAGEAVTGYLRLPGDPLKGVIVPRAAVVRTEGRGWIYVRSEEGQSFTRKEIALEHPTEGGWLIAAGVDAGSTVVVAGAQTLLSFELKGSLGAD